MADVGGVQRNPAVASGTGAPARLLKPEHIGVKPSQNQDGVPEGSERITVTISAPPSIRSLRIRAIGAGADGKDVAQDVPVNGATSVDLVVKKGSDVALKVVGFLTPQIPQTVAANNPNVVLCTYKSKLDAPAVPDAPVTNPADAPVPPTEPPKPAPTPLSETQFFIRLTNQYGLKGGVTLDEASGTAASNGQALVVDGQAVNLADGVTEKEWEAVTGRKFDDEFLKLVTRGASSETVAVDGEISLADAKYFSGVIAEYAKRAPAKETDGVAWAVKAYSLAPRFRYVNWEEVGKAEESGASHIWKGDAASMTRKELEEAILAAPADKIHESKKAALIELLKLAFEQETATVTRDQVKQIFGQLFLAGLMDPSLQQELYGISADASQKMGTHSGGAAAITETDFSSWLAAEYLPPVAQNPSIPGSVDGYIKQGDDAFTSTPPNFATGIAAYRRAMQANPKEVLTNTNGDKLSIRLYFAGKLVNAAGKRLEAANSSDLPLAERQKAIEEGLSWAREANQIISADLAQLPKTADAVTLRNAYLPVQELLNGKEGKPGLLQALEQQAAELNKPELAPPPAVTLSADAHKTLLQFIKASSTTDAFQQLAKDQPTQTAFKMFLTQLRSKGVQIADPRFNAPLPAASESEFLLTYAAFMASRGKGSGSIRSGEGKIMLVNGQATIDLLQGMDAKQATFVTKIFERT